MCLNLAFVLCLVAFLAVCCRWLPPQLLEFDRQSQAKLSSMTAADVSLLLEAFRTYRYAPSEGWLQRFAGG
jgi:hypothetical protein